ncbi:HAD-IA family hydrolase [Roseobacter sp. YSTF-M11]|uniref:HAD-IA family hydrolase n=1 Tax=Roseobacter insulae TaxID=2859783 RepID=A0A9X1K3T8_9RHOB|nr:HAD-IA family hydrolase [Roseobacter insulae]
MRARIVFDLDGTLIDSAPEIQGIANALLAQDNIAPLSLAETRSFIGNGIDVFIRRMRDLRDIPPDRQEDLTEAFVAKYATSFDQTRLYPGVEDSLQKLREHHALGICTNKLIGPCHAVLDHLHIKRFFDTVWGGDSLPTRKPDPAMLKAAFEDLDGEKLIYVGDSEIDAETARRAQVPFLLFTGGYRKSPVDQITNDGTFDHHSELPALIGAMKSV